MDQFTRRIVGFGVQRGAVDGPTLCPMFNNATTRKGTPRYLSTDHDPLFEFHRWRTNLRILEIDEVKTVPYTPTSHPFVERLIGTIRREFLDHTLFWNTLDLERKLEEFRTYYNSERVHSSLNGNTPDGLVSGEVAEAATLGAVCWHFHCGGLVQLPIAA
jgi:putative transposase